MNTMTGANLTSVTEFLLLGLSSDPQIQTSLFIVFLIIYITTLAGNVLIIIIVRVDSHLRTPMYFFLTNLSFLEICYSSAIVPKAMVHFLAERKTISFSECAAQMYIALSLGETECILLGVMAYDRYVAICHPLHYTVIMSKRMCFMMAGASWTGGFLMSLVDTAFTLRLPYCGPNKMNHFVCEVPVILRLACMDTQTTELIIFLVAVVVLLIPFFLILVSYLHIISTVLKIRSAEGRHKAFSTCASHIIVVTLFYGTIIFMYMRPKSSHSEEQDKIITVFYTVVTPMLNPMIYSLKNKEVKGAFRKAIGRNKCKFQVT
ncbi:olfactory receptor 2D3-like [Rhinatrema bivittatum]|uniref:olfactory receptor 2D3-like n=1 Tax=Rhinatrema bivittatum TaxID=194408 RepID=UPI001126DE9A|nr:olfactory receptor 2D3-like [Rhinatrema bivittatum]